jgi:ubiquinone/menaquinone biosynthesis C-methylase UbiE
MMDFHQEMDHNKWEEVFSRQQQRADLLKDWQSAMQLQPGTHVLDLGAGPGYFSLQIAQLIQPNGKVYAIDQAEAAISYLSERMQLQHITNIIPVHSDIKTYTPADPVPAVLLAMVLHHDDNPVELLHKVSTFLAPQGRAVIAEFHPDGPLQGGPSREQRISPTQLTQWLQGSGLISVDYLRQSDEHYMLTVAREQ